jgi:hypothetical protein
VDALKSEFNSGWFSLLVASKVWHVLVECACKLVRGMVP